MTRAAIAIAALLAALVSSTSCRGSSSSDDLAEPIEPPAPAGVDERVDEKPGFLAALTPKQSADVMAPFTTASVALAVKLGDTVTKGQVLARLDDRELRAELDAARAQLKTAEAAIAQAIVERRGAETVLKREKGAEAAGVGAKADLATAIQAVEKATAAISVQRATAGERRARVNLLQAHLAEMTLLAPIAGSVALIYPQDGARVEDGHPVIRLISGGVFVKFAIPADKVGSVKPGDTVDVKLDRRAESLTATVGHVAPELDAVAQMIIADADLVNPPADLQPGTVGRILPRDARIARPTK
jgi:RND family efflux transporter MFP subunit